MFLSSPMHESWCLGQSWNCTTFEVVGIWSVICFYSLVVLVTIGHLLLLPSNEISIESSERLPLVASSSTPIVQSTSSTYTSHNRRHSVDEDMKLFCMLIFYFFTFALGCLIEVGAGVEWVHPVQNLYIQLLGSFILFICSVLFILVHFNLGDSWSPVPQLLRETKHELITDGLYRWARHPMYAVFMWAVVGSFLATLNLLITWCLVAFVILTMRRINLEESILVEKYGDQYLEYSNKVSALGFPLCCF